MTVSTEGKTKPRYHPLLPGPRLNHLLITTRTMVSGVEGATTTTTTGDAVVMPPTALLIPMVTVSGPALPATKTCLALLLLAASKPAQGRKVSRRDSGLDPHALPIRSTISGRTIVWWVILTSAFSEQNGR